MRFLLCVLLATCGTVIFAAAQPAVRITEFMAANASTAVPNAPAGAFDDWIELHNAGDVAADLGGWYLTDQPANLSKWSFPAGTTLAPGDYLVVFANNAGMPDENGNLRTNFALSAAGEYVALVRPELEVVSEFGAGGSHYPPQSDDISYGLDPSDASAVYFSQPTPGAANAGDGFTRIEELTFSFQRGIYTDPIELAIATATPGATLYFTTDSRPPLNADGSPASGAQIYTAPLSITTTTVVRAAALKDGSPPGNEAAHTYLFPVDIATQTRPSGYPTSWGEEPNADYDVDPDVSQSAEDAERFLQGFRDLPTLSVAADLEDLFGTGGIYSNPHSDFEKQVSAEYFEPSSAGDGINGELMFQIPAGMRMQGGASRNPNNAIKHSMSLRFRAAYGASKLEADLFGGSAETEFNSIHLRAMYNHSWIHRDSVQRARTTLITDQWFRDSHIAMGNRDGGSGRFVHLFLNGIYWGVFNLHERPDNDHYAQYSGESYAKDEVFGFNPGSNTSAERNSFQSMISAVTSGDWNAINEKLDVDSYIDYYIIQHFGRNNDLKTNDNWRAAGGGPANAPWRFYSWDSERALEDASSVSPLAISQDGAGLIDHLVLIPEFRARFADRAYQHLHHGGALTNAANRARFEARVAEIDRAIVGESARWGDDRPGGGGPHGDYTRNDDWLKAVYGPLSTHPHNGILGDGGWFPATGINRTDWVIAAWKSQTWSGTAVTKLPSEDPPQFLIKGVPQHGGSLPDGAMLTLSGGPGEIYYTTDGSDPRQVGGQVQADLVAYEGEAIIPSGEGVVKVRWKNGEEWSALNLARFSVGSPAQPGDLRIVELHYNPTETSALERQAAAAMENAPVYRGEDFQFMEILNVSGTTLNLTDVKLVSGVAFTFANIALAPGERVLVAERSSAFAIRYPTAPTPAGQWSGALAKSGETVTLVSAAGEVIDSVSYSDKYPWPTRADGDGASLEIIDPLGLANDALNWRASSEYHGSPGAAGSNSSGRILINEILANTSSPAVDAIELVNVTDAPIDLSGWFLSDSKSQLRKFRIPQGTLLDAGAYLVFDEFDFNQSNPAPISGYAAAGGSTSVTAVGHSLETGEVITISGYGGIGSYNGTWQVVVTGVDTLEIAAPFLDDAAGRGTWTAGQPFALSARGETVWLTEGTAGGELVRRVNDIDFPATLADEASGRWPDAEGSLVPLLSPTFGAPNSPPRVGPLLLAEIMFQPQALPEVDFEFVEIRNPTAEAQSLANWTLRGDVDFDFTSESIPAGDQLVVVGFDPADSVKREAFLNHHGVNYPVSFAGPWQAGGTLANLSGTVRLRRADTPSDAEPEFFPQVIEDEVSYFSTSPWPDSAAGAGDSLHRVGEASFGSEATSWIAEAPSPGRGALSGFELWAFENGLEGGLGGDTDQDGLTHLIEYAFGLDPSTADVELLPQAVVAGDRLTFIYQTDLGRTDVAIRVEGSDDLVDWLPVEAEPLSSDGQFETWQASGLPGATPYFMRFRVTVIE